MTLTAVQTAISVRQQVNHERLASATQRATTDLWLAVGGAGDADLARWADRHLAIMGGATEQAASLGDAYARTLWSAGGLEVVEDTLPDLSDLAAAMERRTASPIGRVRRLLAEGMSYERAMEATARYVSWLAMGDLQTAQGRGVEAGTTSHGVTVTRWKKVTGATACDWCKRVADNPYRSVDSIARHQTCKCGFAPVTWQTARRGSGLRYASRAEFAAAASAS